MVTLPAVARKKSNPIRWQALSPFHRGFYGNLYSKRMGALGEYAPKNVGKLNKKLKLKTADPTTPVIPALHYIAVVAQGDAGKGKSYRMPRKIDSVLPFREWVEKYTDFFWIFRWRWAKFRMNCLWRNTANFECSPGHWPGIFWKQEPNPGTKLVPLMLWN